MMTSEDATCLCVDKVKRCRVHEPRDGWYAAQLERSVGIDAQRTLRAPVHDATFWLSLGVRTLRVVSFD